MPNRTSSSCKDKFTVEVLVSSGKVIGRAQSACNSNVTQSWQRVTFDATSMPSNYAGQTVALAFIATTTADSATSVFFVDDVKVSAW